MFAASGTDRTNELPPERCPGQLSAVSKAHADLRAAEREVRRLQETLRTVPPPQKGEIIDMIEEAQVALEEAYRALAKKQHELSACMNAAPDPNLRWD
jgi:hypothetical protein